MKSQSIVLAAAVYGVFLGSGCSDDDDHHDSGEIPVVVTGTDAADFQTLADYLNHPVVQEIFRSIPRHGGSTPPNLDGSYLSDGVVVSTTIPGTSPGSATVLDFCFGPPAGSALEVAILHPSAVASGALSFIEGTGDLFTVYMAIKLLETGPSNGTCQNHQVLIFSGKREADGSLTGLGVGFGVVGILGDCGNLLVNDVEIWSNSAGPPGASCVGGATPADPTKVLVNVENFLVTDATLFINGGEIGLVPFLASVTFEASPGFTLAFETIPPRNDSDVDMGEILAGNFQADLQPKGRFSQYTLGNQVGDDIFFAPIIQNLTGTDTVTASVNVGTTSAFSCGCSLQPSKLAQYILGYHPYDVPDVITAEEANVVVGPLSDSARWRFDGPFVLGLDSGALSLIVPPSP